MLKSPSFFGAFFCLSLLTIQSFGEVDKDRFQQSFLAYSKKPKSEVSGATRAFHKNTVFVFIRGLSGQKMGDTFKDAIQAAREEGAEVIEIAPPDNSMEENVGFLKNEFEQIVSRSSPEKNFIVTASSRGSVESWATLKLYPEIFGSRLKAGVFTHGPFGGSEMFDFIMEGKTEADLDPPHLPLQKFGQRTTLEAFRKPWAMKSVESMTTKEAQRFVAEVTERSPQSSLLPDDKLLFMTSTKGYVPVPLRYIPNFQISRRFPYVKVVPSHLTRTHMCIEILTQITRRPNDGLVTLPHQFPPGAEARTVIFENLGHLEVIGRPNFGRALTKALLESTTTSR